MSAVFGFLGTEHEAHFQQMQQSLAHRGDRVKTIRRGELSIGYWESSWAAGRTDCGLEVTPARLIGLAGFQTPGPNGKIWTLAEIANALEQGKQGQQGKHVLQQLRGDFVLVFAGTDGSLLLVRDHTGARTIYHATHGNRFYFASEPKGIWSVPDFPRQLNPNSSVKYLTFSFVPGTPTMLTGISEVEPGQWLLRNQQGQYQTDRYFEFERVQQGQHLIGPDNAAASFRELFHSTICERAQLFGRQRPCVLLSGGLDSSIVAAQLADLCEQPIRTFSLHFGEKYANELVFATQVAERLQSEHREIKIEPKDFLKNLETMIWHLDDPIGDPITMPNFAAANQLKSETDFVFNGEGGDPCFGGPKNIPMMLLHWYDTGQQAGFRERAYLQSYRRAYEELEHIFTPEFKSTLDLQQLPALLTPFFECKNLNSLLDKLTAINIRLRGAHLILPKVERMFTASQVTPLSPLFTADMVELSFRIPSSKKLARGIEKIVLKEAFAGELPAEIIQRPKSGMRVPVHFWFQGEMRKYAKKILSPRSIKRGGIFNHRRIKQLLDYNIEEGNGRYGIRLWMLLTFEIWRRIVIDKKGW